MSNKYQIEKGVPIPKRTGRPKGTTKYPWPDMQVGDRVAIPREKRNNQAYTVYASGISSSARIWSLRHDRNFKFVLRKVDAVYYLWRTQ